MEERPIQVSHALGFDLSGHVLDGRYQITRKIGTGGMAAVYEARRIGLDRRFAIKIMRPELAEQESNVKRFLREARSAAAIEHRNIVSIVDVGESSRPVYFVMEYLDGVDLRHVLRTTGRQEWPRTRARALEIVGALAAAHERGIVHRDVKPANCFLVRDEDGRERVKVLDFGIAKVLEESQDYTNVTATHGIVGTVAYMAPEQAKSGTVDKRTDVYALGTMIYEMLAGSVPFPDKNPFVALSRQLADAPTPLREHRPDLSVEIESIVMTCLAKDPDERFQSMEALGGALEAVGAEPVVWTGPMIAAPREPTAAPPVRRGPSAAAPIPHAHPPAQPNAAAQPSGPTHATDVITLRAPEDGAAAPRLRTEVIAQPGATAPSDATPTFPLPAPEASAPVVHGREAAAPMPAAVRSSMQMPVREASRPHSSSVPAARAHSPSTSSVASGQGIAGLVVGAVGMLALGGTVMWWTLHDAPAATEPAPIEAAESPDATPPVLPTPSPVLVPAPEDRDPAVPMPTTPDPSLAPVAEAADTPARPGTRPRPRPTTHDPKLPTVAPDPPPVEPKTTPTEGKNPDVAPGLRNPFGAPPKN